MLLLAAPLFMSCCWDLNEDFFFLSAFFLHFAIGSFVTYLQKHQ